MARTWHHVAPLPVRLSALSDVHVEVDPISGWIKIGTKTIDPRKKVEAVVEDRTSAGVVRACGRLDGLLFQPLPAACQSNGRSFVPIKRLEYLASKQNEP